MIGKTIRCSNCGGNLDMTEGVNKIFCLYCGTQNFLTDVLEIAEVDLTCPRPPIRIPAMEVELLNKIPPRSLEAEQATLGSMMIDPDTIPVATEILRSEDFYIEGHQIMFKAIASLYERGEPADIITLDSELKKLGKLEESGGIGYLTTLVNTVPTASNIEYYAGTVAEKGLLREIIKTDTKIIELGYKEDSSVVDIVDNAGRMVFQPGQRHKSQDFIHMGSVMEETFTKVERLYHNKSHVKGITSGYMELDKITAGFQPGELVIIAVRPGMGKTALALNIAQLVAVEEKLPVAIFSLEMSKEQVAQRLICSQAMVDAHRGRKGYLHKLTQAMVELSKAQIYIDDTPGMSIMEMRAKSSRIKMRANVQVIIIDYLELINSTKKVNCNEQISEIFRGLQALAKELEIPVIGLSQRNWRYLL
jgi:replicative DNA helicase